MTQTRPDSGPFQLMAKPSGPLCNLACRYCFYLDRQSLYPETNRFAMSDDILEAYVRQYIESQPTEVVTFVWQGGEPTLLGVPFFEKALALQKRYSAGKRIENSLQSNGALIDDKWAAFLAAHHFLVGISLDGPVALHDTYRVDRGGKPTFDRVMKGLACLKAHGVEFNTLTTLNARNAEEPRRVYRFLKEVGSRFLQFIPVVERSPRGDVSPESVAPTQYGRFMCDVFDEWVRADVGSVFVQLFDVSLQAWFGQQPGVCVFEETCGQALIVEHNGDVYSCDHYVDTRHRLGNLVEQPLLEIAASPAQKSFGAAKRTELPRQCRDCEYLFACNGDCPKHRWVDTAQGDYPISYLCGSYKTFFTHVAPYMDFMAAELRAGRPPANVMRFASAPKDATPGRNDPCPCGSGKKWKKCCG